MKKKHEVKVLNVTEVSPDTSEAIRVILAEAKTHYEVWTEARNEIDNVINFSQLMEPKIFSDEKSARIHFALLVDQFRCVRKAD